MKVVRYFAAVVVALASSGIADAQLPGLPYSPWQSGGGYFVGPYGSGTTLNPGRGVYCFNLDYVLRFGFLWAPFLSSIGPNNATPSGYSSDGFSACQNGLYVPSAPPPEEPPPEEPPPQELPPPNSPPPPTEPPVTPTVLEPHVTPEPATWVLLGTGLVAILGFAALKSARI